MLFTRSTSSGIVYSVSRCFCYELEIFIKEFRLSGGIVNCLSSFLLSFGSIFLFFVDFLVLRFLRFESE